MAQLNNAMDILKILQKTNCGKCNVPTCLAFAAAVFRGEKRLEDCPFLESTEIEQFEVNNDNSRTLDRELAQYLNMLKEQVSKLDFPSTAKRLDATFDGNALSIKALGKDFHVDKNGVVTSAIHVHGWVTVPLLNYVLNCQGKPLSGNWVHLRELKGGADWWRLFGQRCEKPLKQIADKHTDLFEIMIDVFEAKPAPEAFESDIAVILRPLPRIPILICYWKPDGAMESQLNVFFDDTAEENLDIDSIYRLTAGLVLMFEKVALTHGL
jgi:hypothetical protein